MNEPQTAATEIPTVSLLDGMRFTVLHLLPFYLQGLFTRSRFWVTLMSALHRDAMLVRFTSRLRKKYGACYLYLPVLGSKTLLVLDLSGIRRVLDASPAIYADPEPKRQGMSRFQPGALTISRGLLWQQRRRFNEAVLDFGRGLPRHANHHLEIIRNETRTLLERSRTTLRWKDFDRLFERITLSILFGRSAASDVYLTRTLTRLMRNGNRSRFVPAKKALLESFQAAVRGYLWWPEPKSLARLCREVAPSVTRVESQITHWMFAMNETLATNTVRALALIAADESVQQRVRSELTGNALESGEAIHRLTYLEGSLQEAMRLWPTTPMLLRETLHADMLGGERIPRRTRVLILNAFNHRDRQTVEDADRFCPDRWAGRGVDCRFNHLSNRTQVCAGKDLALFIGTAVVAVLLKHSRMRLKKPRLNPTRSLPHSFNHFRTRIQRLD